MVENITIGQVIIGLLLPITTGAFAVVFVMINNVGKRNQSIHEKLFDKIESVEVELSQLRVHVAENYVTVAAMQQMETRVISHMDKLFAHLEADIKQKGDQR